MKANRLTSNIAGTATVVLLSLLLFYIPTVVIILSDHNLPPEMTRMNIVMSTIYASIFLLNYFLIIPQTLFGHGKKRWFIVSNLILILTAIFVMPLWSEIQGLRPHHPHTANDALSGSRIFTHYMRFAIRDLVMMILSAALAYALQFSRERERLRRRELELDAERRSIELRSLKMQLNPHFLFNSLNNIYALISISPERAQSALHNLSNMLRYMIYDASSSEIDLTKEISFIEDFVRLMRLRLSSSTKVECRVETTDIQNVKVTPLLFLTIVENAFKHFAPSKGGTGYISIKISDDEEWVKCRVENTFTKDVADSRGADKVSGVGLSNVNRQLRLLYPHAHKFELYSDDDVFIADISLRRSALIP